MKAINEFIRKYYPIIIYALFIIAIIIIIAGELTEHKNNSIINNTETSQVRQHVTDSLNTLHTAQLRAVEDSIQAVNARTITTAQNNATYWKNRANRAGTTAAELQHRADSMEANAGAECKQILDALHEVNDSLHSQVNSLTNALTTTEQEAQTWCEQYESSQREVVLLNSLIINKNASIATLTTTTDNLQKQLKRSNNWWNRNVKWITAGIGLGFGILVAK